MVLAVEGKELMVFDWVVLKPGRAASHESVPEVLGWALELLRGWLAEYKAL